MPEEKTPVRLSVAGQNALDGPVRFYEMSMKFTCDAVPAQTADFMAQMGFFETPLLPTALTATIRQTVPFIPDDEVLKRYAETLVGAKSNGLTIKSAKFAGYEWLYAIEPPVAAEKEETSNG